MCRSADSARDQVRRPIRIADEDRHRPQTSCKPEIGCVSASEVCANCHAHSLSHGRFQKAANPRFGRFQSQHVALRCSGPRHQLQPNSTVCSQNVLTLGQIYMLRSRGNRWLPLTTNITTKLPLLAGYEMPNYLQICW